MNYKRILDCLGLMSGLKISYKKSALIPFSCTNECMDRTKSMLHCSVATLPITYLGIPLGVNSKRVQTWRPIIHKVEKKPSG